MASQPWWTFPRIDNFGTIDPAGPYWKPDTNIQVPGDYPIQSLFSGVITSVQQGTSWGQDVITEALNNPINSEATHVFYEHLSSVDVYPGEQVSQGQLLGYNNPTGAVPLGFGFYSGDVYGSGPAWSQLQSDLAPGGSGMLNPTNLLNSIQNSATPYSGLLSSPPGFPYPGLPGNYPPGYPSLSCSNILPQQVCDFFGAFGTALTAMSNRIFWERVGIGLFALLVIILGIKLFMEGRS